MKAKYPTSTQAAWGIVAAATLVATVVTTRSLSLKPTAMKIDRTPMLLVLDRNGMLMAEIECYVGATGDPVWHGEAVAYGSGGIRLATAKFRDGRFVSGKFADGRSATDPEDIYTMKRIISCRGFSGMSEKIEHREE